MKKSILIATLSPGFAGTTLAQSITVDAPSGYKVVVVPSSVSIPQTVNVTIVSQTVCVAPAPAPVSVYHAHPYARYMASVGGGTVIEHQIDDHR